MKIIKILPLVLICLSCSQNSKDPAYSPTKEGPAEIEGYELVWADEFNYTGKPSDDWTYEEGFVRNYEYQWYQADNASVQDGCLLIEGRVEEVENPNYDPDSDSWRLNRKTARYTSACITTQKSHSFKYGIFEVRAKIPTASGSWPAIWTLGNMWEWPYCGEIDIMEFYRRDTPGILANFCWGGAGERTDQWDDSFMNFAHFTDKDPDWADKFHIWKMVWTPESISLYLDDELLNDCLTADTCNSGGIVDNFENPFSNDIEGFGDYILLNLAIGGTNGGEPDESAFPLQYYVDYVRVYQKK